MKRKKRNKLSVQLGIAILIVDILVLLLGFILQYWKVNKILLERTEMNNIQWLEQTEYNIERFHEQAYFVISKLLASLEMRKMTKIVDLSDADRMYYVNAVMKMFNEMRSDYSGIVAITYFGDDGAIIKNTQEENIVVFDNGKTDWYYSSELYLDKCVSNRIRWTSGFTNVDFGVNTKSSEKKYLVSLCARTLTNSGLILVHFDMDYFMNIFFLDDMTGNNMYVVNQKNQVAVANDLDMIGEEKVFTNGEAINDTVCKYIVDGENGQTQIIVYPLTFMEWKVVTESLVKDVTRDSRYLFGTLLRICIWCMIVSVVFIAYWISKTLRPVQTLVEKMKKMKDGELGIVVEEIPDNEIGLLVSEYNSMSLELKKLFLKIQQVEREKCDYEMQALRAQINPHLIFNTLNTIKWMAIIDNRISIAKSITLLADFLKPVFREQLPECSIKEELDYLKDYVSIMNLRKAEKYTLEIHIPEEFYDYSIARFLLQPIVENCILHGFGEELEGKICVSMTAQDQTGIIKIIDNGKGIDEVKLTFLQEQLKNGELSTEKGIGINNVNRRMKLYYGNEYGLTIENGEPHGTIITLTFRLEK